MNYSIYVSMSVFLVIATTIYLVIFKSSYVFDSTKTMPKVFLTSFSIFVAMLVSLATGLLSV